MQKLLREIEAVFPAQVRAIVLDEHGPSVLLSERADVPTALPVYLQICVGQTCRRFITYSGQQIEWQGEHYDVLVDGQGGILLIGKRTLFSSANREGDSASVRVQSRILARLL